MLERHTGQLPPTSATVRAHLSQNLEFRTPDPETVTYTSHIAHVVHCRPSVLQMTKERVQIRVQHFNAAAECSVITLEHIV